MYDNNFIGNLVHQLLDWYAYRITSVLKKALLDKWAPPTQRSVITDMLLQQFLSYPSIPLAGLLRKIHTSEITSRQHCKFLATKKPSKN